MLCIMIGQFKSNSLYFIASNSSCMNYRVAKAIIKCQDVTFEYLETTIRIKFDFFNCMLVIDRIRYE